jgi:hypothetical protein
MVPTLMCENPLQPCIEGFNALPNFFGYKLTGEFMCVLLPFLYEYQMEFSDKYESSPSCNISIVDGYSYISTPPILPLVAFIIPVISAFVAFNLPVESTVNAAVAKFPSVSSPAHILTPFFLSLSIGELATSYPVVIPACIALSD